MRRHVTHSGLGLNDHCFYSYIITSNIFFNPKLYDGNLIIMSQAKRKLQFKFMPLYAMLKGNFG